MTDIIKVRVIDAPGYADFAGEIIPTELPLERMVVRYTKEDGEAGFEIIPAEYVHIIPPVKRERYRWIMYVQQPYGDSFESFELSRQTSLLNATLAYENYCTAVGDNESSARLYVYTDESWDEAEEYRDLGCPFDYPDKLIERGPKGATRVVNA